MTPGVLNRPTLDSSAIAFIELDSEALSILRQMASAERLWPRLGEIISTVVDRELYKEGGYKTHSEWMKYLKTTSGYGRSSLYSFWKAFKELHQDIPILDGISIGTAEELRGIPSAIRRLPEVQEDARTLEAGEFVAKVIVEHPEAHKEISIRKVYRFPASQWQELQPEMAATRHEYEQQGVTEMTDEEIISVWARERKEAREMTKEITKCE